MTDEACALTPLTVADYNAIEQAVMETARGRWFLREYAARNRQADTAILLEAIKRLERAVSGEHATQQVERIRFDLLEMAKSISRLKLELDASQPDGVERSRFDAAASALDAIVKTTEQATSRILEATETVQEVAWSLREKAVDEAACDRIDKLATEIYTACAFQDLTAQQTAKVVRTLRFLEGRINALIDAWSPRESASATIISEPDTADVGEPAASELSQDDIDIVILADDVAETARGGPAATPDHHGAEGELPPNVAAAMANAALAAPQTCARGPILIDDSDLIDIGFSASDAGCERTELATSGEPLLPPGATAAASDAAPQAAACAPSSAPVSSPPTLAAIDALPTTGKVLIFG